MRRREITVLFLTVLAIWFLLPIEVELPHYNSSEELAQSCKIPGSSAVIRFYVGNGGATTAFWYVLTADQDGVFERLFYYSYSMPVIKAVACKEQGVTVQYESNPEQFFSLRDIFEKLTRHPIRMYRGAMLPREEEPTITTSQYAGTVLLLVVLLILYRGRRKN